MARIWWIVSLLGAVVVCFAGTSSAQNLLAAGELGEPGSRLAGWKGDPQGWMLDRFTIVDVEGRRAISVDQNNSFISTEVPVPAGVTAMKLTYDLRAVDMVKGPKSWDVPVVTIRAFDGQGQKVAEQQNRTADAGPQWTSETVVLSLPTGAQTVQVQTGHRLKSGTIQIADLRLVPTEADAEPAAAAPAASDAPLSAEQIMALRKDVASLNGRRGVSIDESAVAETIRVSAEAGEIGEAFERATDLLNQGKGVRLALEPGVHRVEKALKLGELNARGRSAVLVVESAGQEPAVIRGSYASPASEWELVDEGRRIYRTDWNRNFGLRDAGYYTMNKTPLQRRELVVLNGEPLLPAILEQYSFVDSRGRVYDEVGNRVQENAPKGKSGWTYEGFAGLDALKPGTFGVAERDEGHAHPNSLFIRLPEGVTDLSSATIEIATAGEIMHFEAKDNVVLRNLALEHAASWRNFERDNSALRVNGWGDDYSKNLLIENCAFRNNVGQGININMVDGLEIRGMLVEMSGNRGGRIDFCRHFQIDDITFVRNNYIGEAEDSTMHATGGLGTMFLFDGQITNSRFDDNYGFGLRTDAGWEHVELIDNQFNANRGEKNGGGVFHEITFGPIRHVRSRIIGNAERGLFLHNVDNVTVEDSVIHDNRQSGLSIYINDKTRNTAPYIGDQPGGTSGGWARGKRFANVPIRTNDNTVVRNTVVSTTRGADSYLIERTPGVGSKDAYDAWVTRQYTGDGNTFWNPDARAVFTGTGGSWADREFLTLEQWIDVSGEQPGSRWEKPSAGALADRRE